MSDFDKLFENIPWHQRWEIAPGVFTPGANPVDVLLNYASVPADLSGKRVLDIGAWNGCFSFECERRNAAEVLAIGPELSENTGFDKLKDYLGSKVKYELGTIYSLDPKVLGYFDVIICFGVVYHLRHPVLAFDMMRRVCSGHLYLETAGIDENLILAHYDSEARPRHGLVNKLALEERFSGTSLDAIDPILSKLSLLQFYRGDELNGDSTNWFAFNESCCREMLLSSGFRPLSFQRFGHRVAANCVIIPGAPEWMGNSGEGVYYDVISKPLFGERDVYK